MSHCMLCGEIVEGRAFPRPDGGRMQLFCMDYAGLIDDAMHRQKRSGLVFWAAVTIFVLLVGLLADLNYSKI